MQRIIAYASIFAFIVSGLCQGITAGKPRVIIPEKSEITIHEGETLKIQCEGEGKLQFSTQRLVNGIEQSTSKEVIRDSGPGTYTFIRPNVVGSDTGWYACAQEGINIRNDEQTIDHPSEDISWIYVYVNSLDSPFAVMPGDNDYPTVIAEAGETTVIPCRPTHADSKVKLEKNYSELEADGKNVIYDPKIGYIIKNAGRHDSGMSFNCVITETSEAVDYILTVTPKYIVSKDQVKTDPFRYSDTGGNLTLYCNVTVPTEVKVSLDWKAPNSVPAGQLRKTSDLVYLTSEIIHKSSLTIANARPSDAGKYICLAITSHDSANSTTEVKIFDPDIPYIRYVIDGNMDFITESKNGKATWNITIDTYPPNPELSWFKGEMLIENVNHNASNNLSKYSVLFENGYRFYEITHLNISDSGNYTIRIETAQNSSEIQLRLAVHGKPTAVIHSPLPYYKPGDAALISCNATGLPTPNVTWSFSKWQSPQDVESISPLEPVSDGHFSVLSSVRLTIRTMGDLICDSCNEKGCTATTVPIFVSDGAGFFGIIKPQEVIEGDNVTLECTASVYNFTEMVEWELDPDRNDSNSQRMTIETRQTNFTSRAILRIRGVKRTDAGSFVCLAKSKAGDIVTENYTLSVEAAQAPAFTNSLKQESVMYITMKKGETISKETLKCPFKGVPRPEIIWRENGKPLDFIGKHHEFIDNNFTLTVTLAEGDHRNYSCTVKNRCGSIERYFNIVVPGKKDNTARWVSLIGVLIVIIVVVITWMGIKVHRERILRKELLEAGLTHFEEGALECLNPDLTVDEQAELLPYDKKWEFPRELLKLGKQLGSGAFGVVMKAEARGICVEGEVTTVAVKMVRRTADPSYMKALSSELKIMIHLGRHLNVVNLLGACTKTILTKRELYVIVEYCRYGNLHNYLQRHRTNFIDQIDPSSQKIDPNIGIELLARSDSVGSQNGLRYKALSTYRSISVSSSNSNTDAELNDYRQGMEMGDVSMSPDGCVLSNNSVQPGWRSNYRGDYREQNSQPICTQDLLCWAWQVACGMEYLCSRKVLHGDLAARNILLAEDNIVKICDFGLAKNMYKDNNYKKKGDGPLPLKWMAIESIRDRMFSTQSDVWSFGIVLWEFFSLARTPYPGMEAEKQYDRLIEGYRMEKPEYATDEIYDFMLQCWKAKPSLRPSFTDLVNKIGSLLHDGIKMQYLDKNTPYMDMNTQALQNGRNDYLTMMSPPDHEHLNSPDVGSDYLPMSPISKTGDTSIFSPRPEDSVQHFDFPHNEEVATAGSDAADCRVAVEVHGIGNSAEDPIDVHRENIDLTDAGEDRIQIADEPDHPTPVTDNQHYINLKSLDKLNDPDQNLNELEFQRINNKDLSSPRITAQNNYTNLPRLNTLDPPKDPIIDSFSNPSYVIMSK